MAMPSEPGLCEGCEGMCPPPLPNWAKHLCNKSLPMTPSINWKRAVLVFVAVLKGPGALQNIYRQNHTGPPEESNQNCQGMC
jgi:hypothetical protein